MAAARTTRATTSSSAAPFLRLEREQACKGNLMALSMVYTREVSEHSPRAACLLLLAKREDLCVDGMRIKARRGV